jgi:hypothetical protein
MLILGCAVKLIPINVSLNIKIKEIKETTKLPTAISSAKLIVNHHDNKSCILITFEPDYISAEHLYGQVSVFLRHRNIRMTEKSLQRLGVGPVG